MSQKSGTMFRINAGRKKKRDVRLVLGPGCTVEGTLTCKGPTRLAGSVTGALIADEYLVIDETSTVTADLNVQELVVRGKVKGNIRAKRRVTLDETATVEGDIRTPNVTISDGAQVIGKVEVTRRGAEPAEEKPTAEIRKFLPQSIWEKEEATEAEAV